MAQYQTPNVYVEEKSTLPPSVAEVPTAIPVFIGYTEKSIDGNKNSIVNQPIKIKNMAEYTAVFGGKAVESFGVFLPYEAEPYVLSSGTEAGDGTKAVPTFKLAQSVEHFFANGGGACYVVSTGSFKVEASAAATAKAEADATAAASARAAADAAREKANADAANDAVSDGDKATSEAAAVAAEATADSAEQTAAASLAAATSMATPTKASYKAALDAVALVDEITLICLADAYGLDSVAFYSLQSSALEQCRVLKDRFTLIDTIEVTGGATTSADITLSASAARDNVAGELMYGAAYYPNVVTAYARHYSLSSVDVYIASAEGQMPADITPVKLSDVNTSQLNMIKKLLTKNYLTLPPTPGVAGVIAKTDGSRGVWKAPANVALTMVQRPTTTVTNDDQKALNVDVDSGKSINAIRQFTGKGNLVWGARTLMGNDNEWRYISVRRLFNMVEESIQKSTAFAVFEPNTPFTWLKLKTMISSYLENLWKQGALFGDSPAQAFFVNVGLGQTMTEDDINNGVMNIEIGLAAVRPAEFIVLTFSHKSLEG